MSILIKGMEMPKEGKIIVIYKLNGQFYASMNGTELCPLVEVPTPHGSLIEREKLRDAIYHHLCIKGEENLLPAEKSVFGNIIKAPIIIEAEE